MGGKNNAFNKIGSNLGLIGKGGFFGGAQQVQDQGFSLTPEALEAEKQVLAQQQAIANGQAPSIANMQYQQALNQATTAGLAQAASARGVNPALAFRAANRASQQVMADAAGNSAILAEEERRRAAQQIAQMVAAQRGVALNMEQANLDAKNQYRGQTAGIIGAAGGIGAAAAGGKK